MALTYIHHFFIYNFWHVISRDSKISCRYNFLKYLAFTYFIMLSSEMTEMKLFPRNLKTVDCTMFKL